MSVINQLEQHQVKRGSVEQRLQELILGIAHSVENKQGLTSELIQRINRVFEENQSVRLKVALFQKISTFCSSKCRSRYNYLMKEKNKRGYNIMEVRRHNNDYFKIG